MNAKLSDLLSMPVPEVLWHYTDIAALQNIVETQRMRATDVLYMNDKEEFIHAQKIVARQIESLPEDGDLAWVKEQAKKIALSFFDTGSLSKSRMQLFVVSFTTLDDSLSQWDRYADLSRGAALGFNLSGVRPPFEIGTLLALAPCVYLNRVKEELIGATLQEFTEAIRQLWASASDEVYMQKRWTLWREQAGSLSEANDLEAFKAWNNTYYEVSVRECSTVFAKELLHLCALCKHSGFKEESEWRLVLPIDPARELINATRKVRMRGEQEVPYIETVLSFDDSKILPLIRVTLGPCYDGQSPVIERVESGELVPVDRSEIPYHRFNFALPCANADRATGSQ